MSQQGNTYFDDCWLEDDEFKSWLSKPPDRKQARCKLCKKTFELSNMGVNSLRSHASGKKHKSFDMKIKSFFKPAGEKKVNNENIKINPAQNNMNSPSDIGSDSLEKIQSTLEVVVTNSNKIKAEIVWALKCIHSGYSDNSNNDMNDILKSMFPDSKIADSFEMGPDKLHYYVNFGIAPYFKSLLIETLKKSECYVLSFDESLNDFTQTSEMDLLVRFFDESTNTVKTRYLDSRFLGHATSADLQKQFNDISKELDSNKLFQISMDGPNVNLKFYDAIVSERSENEQHQLINIGSCGLHTIHGSFKTGFEKSDWKIKKILKGAYYVFHDSPAKREDYTNETESTQFPKYFCGTR